MIQSNYKIRYKNALKFLYNLQFRGVKFGLENIRKLCNYYDNPQDKYPTIHIAGTNGKGSTAAMIASILTASGYKTGLYTSPHLVDFSERIRIDGRPINSNILIHYINELSTKIDQCGATFFETTTVIAFKYFFDQKVDLAVIETGLGGRLDSTNIIVPEISLITTIGYDHMQQLGSTLTKIAYEKAGIIKQNIPCITSVCLSEPLQVLKKVARKQNSEFIEMDKLSQIKLNHTSINYQVVNVKVNNETYKNLNVGLIGNYQKDNIRIALIAVKYLKERKKYSRICQTTIRSGLQNIRKNTGIRGRMEILRKSPFVIGDVAHNSPAFEELSKTYFNLGFYKAISVFGIMKDKDIKSILPYLKKMSSLVIACTPYIKRGLKSNEILRYCWESKIPCIDGKTVQNSLKIAFDISQQSTPILICGSHYVLGEAIKILDFFK